MISHNFGLDLATYNETEKKIRTPLIFECLDCGGKGLLHRHGFYSRYVITEDGTTCILICRLKCRHCNNTFSVIPDFLIPHFQHSLHTIIDRIKEFLEVKKIRGSRQLLSFYLERFKHTINWIHSFFVDLGEVSGMPREEKERATKYLKMIQDFGESTFLRRSQGHCSSHFMAN